MWINPLRATFIAAFMIVGGAIASEGVDDILRLQRAGVSEDVQLAFIGNQNIAYDPTAIELETMERDGISASVMVAMIDRGRAVRAGELSTTPAPSADAVAQGSPVPGPVQPVGDPVATSATVTYAPPAEEMNVSFMYEAMSPHGKWYEDSDYGWVWQPTVVVTNTEWRPYVDSGHWEWTDHGWFWVSDYEWGWAPFHYGRWHRHHHHHWVWVPDTTWGPAWVSWRQSDDYYGWAPLPPRSRFSAGIGFSFRNENVGFNFHFGLGERDFTFVAAERFCDRDFHRHAYRGERGRNIYNRTTIVNNTYVYNDNRVINNGIPRERVERSINRRLETVRIREERVEAGRPIPRNRQTGTELAVFKPQVRDDTPVTPPVAAQRRQERIQQRQAKQARTEMREQNQQAADARQQNREQAQAAARERLQQEKTDRQANREKSVQERDAASAKRAQEAQARQTERQTDRQQNATQREQQAQQRQQAQQAEREKAHTERQQSAAEREAAIRQRAEQEKAQREAGQAQRQQKAQQRETQRQQEAQQQERQQAEQARQQQAHQRQQEAQQRQQQAQERKQDRQERAQERQQERRESLAPRARGRDRD